MVTDGCPGAVPDGGRPTRAASPLHRGHVMPKENLGGFRGAKPTVG